MTKARQRYTTGGWRIEDAVPLTPEQFRVLAALRKFRVDQERSEAIEDAQAIGGLTPEEKELRTGRIIGSKAFPVRTILALAKKGYLVELVQGGKYGPVWRAKTYYDGTYRLVEVVKPKRRA